MIAFPVAALLLLLSSAALAQPAPLDCPLPPYQPPRLAPERAFIDENGAVIVSGIETPFELPDGLKAERLMWSDDGAALLIEARDGFTTGVFTIRDGALVPLLDNSAMLKLRSDDFRDAVTLFNPKFIPGTHTVMFNTQVLTDAEGIYFELPRDLWSLDLDAGKLTGLIPFGEAGQFSITPDGKDVVIVDPTTLWTIDLAMSNPRELIAGTMWVGVGHGVIEPPIVWDYDAEVPTFRTLLFPDFDASVGQFNAPFQVYEFTLGEPTTKTLLFSGPTDLLFNVSLSPDGYRVAEWREVGNSDPRTVELWVTSYGDPTDETGTVRHLLTTFPVPAGNGTLVQWADETHLRIGYHTPDGTVESMVDLCGEVVPPTAPQG